MVREKISVQEVIVRESEIVEILRRENEEYRRLEREHRELDMMLSEIESKKFLTPDDEVEIHRIKKLKLQKKDKMAEIIREWKKMNSVL